MPERTRGPACQAGRHQAPCSIESRRKMSARVGIFSTCARTAGNNLRGISMGLRFWVLGHAGRGNAPFCNVALATCCRVQRSRPLPVDAWIPESIFTSTHAITMTHHRNGCGRGSRNWAPVERAGTAGCDRQRRDAKCDEHHAGVSDRCERGRDAGDSGRHRRVRRRRRRPTRDLVLTVPDGRGGSAVAWEHVLNPLPAAERDYSSEGVPPRIGWTLLGRRRLTVTAGSSSNARMRRWRCFRARCSLHSRDWAIASWRRGIFAVFTAAAGLRRRCPDGVWIDEPHVTRPETSSGTARTRVIRSRCSTNMRRQRDGVTSAASVLGL